MKMLFVKITNRLFGWDWIEINYGFGTWRLHRVRVLWDGEIVYRRHGDRFQKVPPHDYILSVWLTCDPSKYISKDKDVV